MPRKRKKVTLGPGVCDGCGKCIEACLGAAPEQKGRGAGKIAGIKLFKSGSTYVPVICRHCEDAPCVTACMSGCRQRNGDGRVITDYSRCVGCWMCIMSCPFGAIERDKDTNVALKCEGCSDKEVPPCVAACERGILDNRDVQNLSHALREKAATRFITGEDEDT